MTDDLRPCICHLGSVQLPTVVVGSKEFGGETLNPLQDRWVGFQDGFWGSESLEVGMKKVRWCCG